MSLETNRTLTIDGHATIDPQCPAYYFNYAPVLERCEALRNHPERLALLCKNHVRQLAPAELMLTADQGFFLVVQTRSGAAADAVAREIELSLLELLFGSDSLIGLASISHPVSANELAEAGFTVSAPQPSPDTPPAQAVAMSRQTFLPQGALPGCAQMKLGFLPMLNLQREAPSIFLCGPVGKRDDKITFGSAALKDCDPKDRVLLDEAMLEHSLGFARQIVPTKFAAAICTSVSYETLASSRGRQLYQNALRCAGAANMPFLIVKIDDIPPGTPSSRLAEIVATVRPYVKRVFVQLPDSDIGLMQSGHIGAAGLCVTLPARATPPEIVRLATWLNRAAMVQQAVSCVDAVENHLALPLLRAAGIRFAAGRADDENIKLDLPLGGEPANPACAA